jgi:DNA (cytosine-5)-methyltransferase 1
LSAGISAGAAYDSSRAAILTYDANLPSTGRQADLARFAPDDACDVLLAGAPCQGFSTVGKHLPDDPRNALLARVGDIALRLLPKVIVVENVPAALSARNGRLWRALEDRLRLGGYNTITMTLIGEESGLAQRRRRLFMLCWRGMNETRVEIERVEAPSLRAVLAGAEALSDHVANYPLASSAEARIARRIQPGQKLCNVRSSLNAVPTWAIPEVFGSTSNTEREVLEAVSKLRRRDRRRNYGDGDPVEPSRLDIHVGRQTGRDVMRLVDAGYLRMIDGAVELRQTYNGKYRRLSWDDLAPTVDTHYGRMTLFMHPEQNRGLSAREAARIQGFPDAYVLAGKARDHFAIIGNAVPPPMAARLATFIREALLKR